MSNFNVSRALLLVVAVVVLAGCVEEEQLGDVARSGQTNPSTPDTAAAGVTTTSLAATTTTAPSPTDTSVPTTTATTLFSPDASFCESLEVFFEAWALFLQPADLTPAYETLGELAPPELVNDFAVLAVGNDILVATKDRDALPDPAGYDASGQRVAVYAMEECGIDPEDFERG